MALSTFYPSGSIITCSALLVPIVVNKFCFSTAKWALQQFFTHRDISLSPPNKAPKPTPTSTGCLFCAPFSARLIAPLAETKIPRIILIGYLPKINKTAAGCLMI
ncbi:MAG: hypothetical protein V1685_07595 [Parcubacteria group bacterium]